MFTRIDAAVEWGDGNVYFFSGDEYVRFNTLAGAVDVGPRSIADHWPGLWASGIDAAVNWGNGKVYFFRGNEYMRYDIAADRADDGYPRAIGGSWPGLWDADIDAALNWWNGKAYFFKGGEYIRYDIVADRTDPGYPAPIAGHWPGLFERDLDAAAQWGDGKAYFFKGSEYVRYDVAGDGADLGPVALPDDLAELPANGGGARPIAWGSRVSAAFRERVTDICRNLGVEPGYLMTGMAFETGRSFSPSVRNAVSGATGLIQFMPSTAASLGTSTDRLAMMTAEDQLEYVARYFAPYRGKLRTLADIYMTILWPAAVGKPADYVLFSSPAKTYTQNAGLDFDKDGKVLKIETERKVRPLLAEGLKLAG